MSIPIPSTVFGIKSKKIIKVKSFWNQIQKSYKNIKFLESNPKKLRNIERFTGCYSNSCKHQRKAVARDISLFNFSLG
jgi:hypothetical protein